MKTLRELFKPRNAIPAMACIVAFVAASGFLEDLLKSHQIILILLGILAIDAVVERLGYLSKIEESVRSLSETAGKSLFLDRAILNADESFEQFVAQGRDVLITGTTLVGTVVPYGALFRKTLRQGTNLRFLLLDPESQCVEPAARFFGISPEALRLEIGTALKRLREIRDSLDNSRRDSIQVRFLRTVPNAGMAMRDGDRDTGKIRCELYLPQTDVACRPAFCLRPADGAIYHRYRDAIEHLWNDSQPWTPE